MASDADPSTRALIRALASQPERVQTDPHATGNMLAWQLTLDDVCEAVCSWIDEGERVKPTLVKAHPQAMIGMAAYELSPVPIASRRYYIRLTVYKPDQSADALLILSLHSS